jgi:carotenoid cleavage dioxygenase-like enzyme
MNKPYLTGHYTPVTDEITAMELTVEGSLPPELTGRLVRNSHNPKPGVTPTHWFKGRPHRRQQFLDVTVIAGEHVDHGTSG